MRDYRAGGMPMRMLLRLAVVFAAIVELAAAPAPKPAPRYWQGLTRTDVDAAYALLHDNHPGASLELDDAAFRARLSSAYAQAEARALKVNSFEGYVATLGGFAVAMGDKHIWSRPLFARDSRVWAGLLIARRGGNWVVAADDNDSGSLKGARLVSCDGIPADTLARRRIGEFYGVWSIEAQRIQRAPWLLLDDGNPFLERPRRCTFADAAGSRDVELKWRDISRVDLNAKAASVPTRGKAGFGLRQSGKGWWIGLESLSDRAEGVVAEVRDKKELLRNAPFIVVDVRGNDGGNSMYGHELARTLLGDDYVKAAMSSEAAEDDHCPKLWRASPGNLEHLAEIGRTVVARAPEPVRQEFASDFASLRAAAAKGHDFAGKPCRAAAAAETRPASLPPWPLAGKVYLLTDNSCFSSCLLMTDEFRRLGPIHVGEATDAATNYMEVREEILPSGLSAFSTLQAVATGAPHAIGPFVPAILYPGSIADTQALESWIADLASAH